MHSSRMRTILSSGHMLGGVPGPGGTSCRGCLVWGVYLVPRGDVPGKGVCWSRVSVPGGWGAALGGTRLGGVSSPRGLFLISGGMLMGVYLVRHPPCGQTHTCKNITFATLLLTVNVAQGILYPMSSIAYETLNFAYCGATN